MQGDKSPSATRFSLTPNRLALLVLLILVLANALAAGLRTVADTDMGWHIATGRWILLHHSIPSSDVLSYTAHGRPWLYPPFAGVLFALIDQLFGPAGLSWFSALACLATVAVLLRRPTLPAIALALCAIEPIAFRTAPRADAFNTILLALVFSLLWDYQRGLSRRLRPLPILILLWVNLHPGFIVGLACIAAYLLLEFADLLFAPRRVPALQRLRRAWPWLLSALAVTLLNPAGPRIYSVAYTLSGLAPQQQGAFNTSALIGEFLSVPLNPHLIAQLLQFRHAENGFTWLLLIALVTIAIALWRRDFAPAILQATALYLAVQHARYIGLFCVLTAILGATLIQQTLSSLPAPNPARAQAISSARWAFLAGLAILAILHTADFVSNRTHVVFATDSAFGPGQSSWFPQRAADFIRANHLPGPIYQEYGLGGFTAWRLGPQSPSDPGYPDFIDGRFDHLAPDVLASERSLLNTPPDSPAFTSAADTWGINLLLISEAAPRAAQRQNAAAFCHSANWRPVYMDEVSLVLLRNTPANQPLIARLQVNCFTQPLTPPVNASAKARYDFDLSAGGLLFAIGRDSEAETLLLNAQSLFPDDPNATTALAGLYMRHQLWDRAQTQYLAALDRQDSDGLWYALGTLYLRRQQLPLAEDAFQRAASLSVSPMDADLALAQVDILLQHPQAALDALDGAEKHSPYRDGAEDHAPLLYARIAEGRALASRQLGQLQLALTWESRAIQLDPSNAPLWQEYASILDAAGQPDTAQQARLRAATIANPQPSSAPAQ